MWQQLQPFFGEHPHLIASPLRAIIKTPSGFRASREVHWGICSNNHNNLCDNNYNLFWGIRIWLRAPCEQSDKHLADFAPRVRYIGGYSQTTITTYVTTTTTFFGGHPHLIESTLRAIIKTLSGFRASREATRARVFTNKLSVLSTKLFLLSDNGHQRVTIVPIITFSHEKM